MYENGCSGPSRTELNFMMLPADGLKYNRMLSLIPSSCNTSTGYGSPAGVRKLVGLGAIVLMSVCLMADTHDRDADHV